MYTPHFQSLKILYGYLQTTFHLLWTVLKKNGWSSFWTILALAEVISIPIESVYLPLNGVQDKSYKFHNLLALPRNSKDENVKVIVMWTRTAYKNPKQIWNPNHFVPLIKPSTTSNLSSTSTQLHLDSFIDFPPLSSTPVPFNASRCSIPKHQFSPVDSSSTNRPTPPFIDSLEDFPSHSSSSKSDFKLNQPAISTSPSSQSKIDTDTVTTVHHEPANYFSENHLQRGNLTATEVFQSIINTENTVYEKIPNGPKENVYFLIDNSSNVVRKSYTKSSQFANDCGAWDSHSDRTVKSDFIVQSDNTYVTHVLKTISTVSKNK